MGMSCSWVESHQGGEGGWAALSMCENVGSLFFRVQSGRLGKEKARVSARRVTEAASGASVARVTRPSVYVRA